MKQRTKAQAIIGFLFWSACAVGMFILVAHLHTSGKFAEWYYYTANEEGYAIDADQFDPAATKDNPTVLKVIKESKLNVKGKDFKYCMKNKDCEAVYVKKGDRLPINANGIINVDTLGLKKKIARDEGNGLTIRNPTKLKKEKIKGLIDKAEEKGYAVSSKFFSKEKTPGFFKFNKEGKLDGPYAVAVLKGEKTPEGTDFVISEEEIDPKKDPDKEAIFGMVGNDFLFITKEIGDAGKGRIEGGKSTFKEKKEEVSEAFAVNSASFKGATKDKPVFITVVGWDTKKLDGAQAQIVKTGKPVPEGADRLLSFKEVGKKPARAEPDGDMLEMIEAMPPDPKSMPGERALDNGFAVNTASFAEASKDKPVVLTIDKKATVVEGAIAIPVKSKDPMPEGADALVTKKMALSGKPGKLIVSRIKVLIPWQIKDAKGFKFKDTFKHKGIKTYPWAGVFNVLIVAGLGISLGCMAEFFTDMIGLKVEKIHHFEGH